MPGTRRTPAMTVPTNPKLYHIVHVDRLRSIIRSGGIWSDAEVRRRKPPGTEIGMSSIKERRLGTNLTSHPDLAVGECVPFYFCPRSVMLFVIHMANSPELAYRGGQDQILHLELDLYESVAWANERRRKWAFTLSNAGSSYFEDRADLARLHEIDWEAVGASDWRGRQEGKQAEFLVERSVAWTLVRRVGCTEAAREAAIAAVNAGSHRPPVVARSDWYY